MSIDPAAVALGAAACGLVGTQAAGMILWIPQPPPDPERPLRPTYAEVAARPGLGLRSGLVAAIVGGLLGAAVGLDWPLLYLLPLVPVSVALAEIDRRTQLLPVALVWPALGALLVLGVATALLDQDLDALLRAALAGAAVFAFFSLLWRVRAAGMGYGDVRVSAGVGFALGYLGWPEVVVGVYAGFLVFGLLGLARAVVHRDRGLLKVPVPYGPALLGGVVVGVVLGPPVWHLVGG